MPLPYKVTRQIGRATISGTATGATLLGTTENGTQLFVPQYVVVHALTLTGVVTMFTYSVGTNSTAYNNIVPSTTTGALAGINVMQNTAAAAGAIVVPANTGIYLNISIAAVATAVTFDAELFGYYK